MANPKYYLKDTKSRTETPIKLYWKIGEENIVWGTRIKIHPKLWSKKRQRVLNAHPNAKSYNSKLERILIACIDVVEELQREKTYITRQDFYEALDIELGYKKSPNSFYSFFDNFIQEKLDSTRFSNSSIGSYTSARTLIKAFAEEKQRGREVDFADFNYNLWQDFEEFLLSRQYSVNYAFKIMTRIISRL